MSTTYHCGRYRELLDELKRIRADVSAPSTSATEAPLKRGELSRQARLLSVHIQRCRECVS